jgi:hypothetical protein
LQSALSVQDWMLQKYDIMPQHKVTTTLAWPIKMIANRQLLWQS